MNRIWSATKLDFHAGKSMIMLTAALAVIAIIVGLVAHGPEYAMFFTMIFGVTSCGSVFSIHEKNHSDKLYGILPLKKSEMIVGRYLYGLIIGVVYIVFAAVLGFVLWKIMGDSANLTALGYWATLGAGFVYFGFAMGVAFPIYFKFSFSKAYVFTMLPMYIIAVLFLILTRKNSNFTSDLGQFVKFFTDHMALAPIFGVLGGLILLAVSLLIANLIYTRKEI
ncbi:MAG: ABC-2 transporter permease [Oscillospiraceae bacterium]|nr:ABC-2 transporter permease [Oscillospiraceae bacterium]